MKKILIFVILVIAVAALFLVYSLNNSKKEEVKEEASVSAVNMKITSTAFQNNTKMPAKYSCDGEGVNPPLSFSDIPENTKSLVLIVDDPDAPIGTYIHWILFNIDPKTRGIEENSAPQSALRGKTSAGGEDYVAACPPSGTHRYFFKLYSLDTMLDLENPDKYELETEMQDHIIEKTEMIGLYSR